MRNLEIKTTIEKDTTLNFPVWHKNRTREAFLMHVMAVLDGIKKNVVISWTTRRLRRFKKKQRKPLSQPELVYPCSTVPEQSQNSFASRRPEKPLRKLLQRPKPPSQKPGKPRKLPR